MRNLRDKLKILGLIAYAGLAATAFAPPLLNALVPSAYAIPFGQGKFGNDLYGSPTSLSVSLGGDVNLALTSDGSKFSGSGSHTVTVASTDVIGYSLYAYANGTSAMTGTGGTIPASSNSTLSTLATNTWGYNIDGSNNYLGMGTSPSLIKTAAGEYRTGDPTTVKYGVLTDLIKQPGSYTVSVVYTAVALSQ